MKQIKVIFLLTTIAILFLVSCQSGNNIKSDSDPIISPTNSPTFSPTTSPTPRPLPTSEIIGEFGKDSADELLWSPDGKYLIVRTSDQVELINTETWKIETILDISFFDSMETQLFFSPQGTVLHLVIERDYKREIWRYDLTNKVKKRFIQWKLGLDHSFGSLFYLSPTNKYMAIAEQNHLEIMDLETDFSKDIQILNTWGYENDPNVAVFSQDESQIALGMQNNVIKIINPDSGRILFTLNHNSHVNDLSYSPNDEVLVSASNDATVKFWNTQSGKLSANLDDFLYGTAIVQYFDNGSKLLIGEENTNKFYIYNVDELYLPVELEQTTIISEGSNIHNFKFNPDSMEIAVLQGGTVEVWNLNSGTLERILPEYGSGSGIALISPDSQQLAVVNSNIHLWNISQHKWITALPIRAGIVDAAVFSPVENILAVSSDKSISLWDTNKQENQLEIPISIEGQLLAFSNDGSLLAAADFDQILILNTNNGETIQRIKMDFTNPYLMCFSEDKTHLFFISEEERTAWKISSGEKLYGTSVNVRSELSIAISPNIGLIVEAKDENYGYNKFFLYSFFDPISGDIRYTYKIYDYYHQPGVFMDPIGNMLVFEPGGMWFLYTTENNNEVLHRPSGFYSSYTYFPNLNIRLHRPYLQDYFVLEDISSYIEYLKVPEYNIVSPFSTPTPMSTETPTPEITTEMSHDVVQIPEVAQIIKPENINSLSLLNELSTGNTYTSAWSIDGQLLAIENEKGVDIIKMESFETIAHIETTEYYNTLLFSPDSQYLAMRAFFAELKVFNIATEKEIFSNYDEMCRDQHIRFGEDSKTLTLYCEKKSYQWNLASKKLLTTNNESYSTNKATGNSENLDFIQEDSSMRLFNINSNQSVHTFDIPNYMPVSAGISPDGNVLFVWFYEYNTNNREGIAYPSVESNSILQIWGVDENQKLQLYNSININTHTHPSTAFTTDSKFLFTSIGDGSTRVFSLPSGQLLTTFDELSDFSVSPDGKHLYAESMPETVWDVSTSTKPTMAWNRTQFKNTNIFLSVTNENEMVTRDGNTFNFWKIDKANVTDPILTINARDKDIVTAAVSPDGNWLAYISYNHAVVGKRNGQYVNWFTIRTYESMEKEYFYDCSMMFSPDSSMIVVKDMYYDLDLWRLDNLSAGSTEFEPAKDYYLSSYLFSPDSKYIIGDFQHGYGSSAFFYVWNIETSEEISKWKDSTGAYTFHPNENMFAELWVNKIFLRDITNPEIENSINFDSSGTQGKMEYDSKGKIIALSQNDGIYFIDGSTGINLHNITGYFEDFHFTPDGKYLITIGRNNQIKIWGIAE